MKLKLNYLFCLLMLSQLQIDLLLVQYQLQGLLIILLYLFVYPKKLPLFRSLFVFGLFLVEKFITHNPTLVYEALLVLASLIIIKILKRNLAFKSPIFYLILISYLFTASYLANIYIFAIPFCWQSFYQSIISNFIYSNLLFYLLNQLSLD